MAGGLDELVEYLMEKVALQGVQGSSFDDITAWTHQFYELQSSPDRQISLDPSVLSNKPHVDHYFAKAVWRWLNDRDDTFVEFQKPSTSDKQVSRHGKAIPSDQNVKRNAFEISQDEPRGAQTDYGNYIRPSKEHSPAGDDDARVANHASSRTELPSINQDIVRTSKAYPMAADKITDREEALIYANQDRTWHAITGHGVDHRRVPPMQFQLLCIISSAGEEGILQPDIVAASGQDKRSVPKRTDTLCEAGYIEKKRVIGHGTRTSLCTLKKFLVSTSTSQKSQQRLSSREARTSKPVFWSGVLNVSQYMDTTLHILKEADVVPVTDLKDRLGCSKDHTKGRLVYHMFVDLERYGLLKRVGVPVEGANGKEVVIRCCRFLRDPTDRERDDFIMGKNLGRPNKQNKRGNPASFSYDGEAGRTETQDDGLDQEIRTPSFKFPKDQKQSAALWTPDRPLFNLLFDAIAASGSKGMSSMTLRQTVGLEFWKKPLDAILGRLTDRWEDSQPGHLSHLSIIKDTSMEKKASHYLYRSFDSFQKAVDAGSASWQAVETRGGSIQKGPRKNIRYGQELDQWGFPVIPREQLLKPQGQALIPEQKEKTENIAATVAERGLSSKERERRLQSGPRLREDLQPKLFGKRPLPNRSSANSSASKLAFERGVDTKISDSSSQYATGIGSTVKFGGDVYSRPIKRRKTDMSSVSTKRMSKHSNTNEANPTCNISTAAASENLSDGHAEFLTSMSTTKLPDDKPDERPPIPPPNKAWQIFSDQAWQLAHRTASIELIAQSSEQTSPRPEASNSVLDDVEWDPESDIETSMAALEAKRYQSKSRTLDSEKDHIEERKIFAVSNGHKSSSDINGGLQSEDPKRDSDQNEQDAPQKKQRLSKTKEKDGGSRNPEELLHKPVETQAGDGLSSFKQFPISATVRISSKKRGKLSHDRASSYNDPSPERVNRLYHDFYSMSRSGLYANPPQRRSFKQGRPRKQMLLVFKLEQLNSCNWFQPASNANKPHVPSALNSLKIQESMKQSIAKSNGALNAAHAEENLDICYEAISPSKEDTVICRKNSASQSGPLCDLEEEHYQTSFRRPLSNGPIHPTERNEKSPTPVLRSQSSSLNQPMLASKDHTMQNALNDKPSDARQMRKLSHLPSSTFGGEQGPGKILPSRQQSHSASHSFSRVRSRNESVASTERNVEITSKEVGSHIGFNNHDHDTGYSTPDVVDNDNDTISQGGAMTEGQSRQEQRAISGRQETTQIPQVSSRRRRATRPKTGIKRGEGIVALHRKEIIMEIIHQAGGVFPGDRELWSPFCTVWVRTGKGPAVDIATVRRASDNLVRSGALQRFTFACKLSGGITVTRSILCLPGISPTDQRVREIERKIIEHGRDVYVPDNVDVSPNFRPMSNTEKWKSGLENPQESYPLDRTAKLPLRRPAPSVKIRHQEPAWKQWAKNNLISTTGPFKFVDESVENGNLVAAVSSTSNDPIERAPGEDETSDDANTDLAQAEMQSKFKVDNYSFDPGAVLRKKRSTTTRYAQRVHLVGPSLSKEKAPAIDTHTWVAGTVIDPLPSKPFVKRREAAYPTITGPDQTYHAPTGTFSTDFTIKRKRRPFLAIQPQLHQDFEDQIPQNLDQLLSRQAELMGKADISQSTSSLFDEINCVEMWEKSFSNLLTSGKELAQPRFINHTVPQDLWADVAPLAKKAGQEALQDTRFRQSQKRAQTLGASKDNTGLSGTPQLGILSCVQTEDESVNVAPQKDRGKPASHDWEQRFSDARLRAEALPVLNETQQDEEVTEGVSTDKAKQVYLPSSKLGYRHFGKTRGSKRLAPRSDLPGSKVKRLLIVVIIVRTLLGRPCNYINWEMVTCLFDSDYDKDNLKARWPSLQKSCVAELEHLQSEFEQLFLDGYEKGDIPQVDYRELQHYDWEMLVQYVLDKSSTPFDDGVVELPENRDDLIATVDESASHEIPMAEILSRKLRGKRYEKFTRDSVFYLPLQNPEHGSSIQEELSPNDPSLAKSYVRANILTPESSYDPSEARQVLANISINAIDDAIVSFTESKAFRRKGKGRLVPGRNWEIGPAHLSAFADCNLPDGPNMRARALSYKEDLDRTLAPTAGIQDPPLKRAKTMPLKKIVSTEEVFVLMELFAAGKINLQPDTGPITHEVFGTRNFPKGALSIWGMIDVKKKFLYNTRLIEIDDLCTPVTILPTKKYYEKTNMTPDMPNLFAHAASSLKQRGSPETPMLLPYWGSIHGEFLPSLFHRLASAVLSMVAQQPGVDAEGIAKRLSKAAIVNKWEIEAMLQLLKEADTVETRTIALRQFGLNLTQTERPQRWFVKEGWWSVLGRIYDEQGNRGTQKQKWNRNPGERKRAREDRRNVEGFAGVAEVAAQNEEVRRIENDRVQPIVATQGDPPFKRRRKGVSESVSHKVMERPDYGASQAELEDGVMDIDDNVNAQFRVSDMGDDVEMQDAPA